MKERQLWLIVTISFLASSGLTFACKGRSEPIRETATASTESPKSEGTSGRTLHPGAKVFGAALTDQPRSTLAELLAQPEAHLNKTLLVEGSVRRACSRKGCWMEVASDAASPGVRVTFKDYGFFVPTDSAGSRALIQGVVELEEVKKSHVDHLESEGAKFERKREDGSALEVRLVANGVELWRG